MKTPDAITLSAVTHSCTCGKQKDTSNLSRQPKILASPECDISYHISGGDTGRSSESGTGSSNDRGGSGIGAAAVSNLSDDRNTVRENFQFTTTDDKGADSQTHQTTTRCTKASNEIRYKLYFKQLKNV